MAGLKMRYTHKISVLVLAKQSMIQQNLIIFVSYIQHTEAVVIIIQNRSTNLINVGFRRRYLSSIVSVPAGTFASYPPSKIKKNCKAFTHFLFKFQCS